MRKTHSRVPKSYLRLATVLTLALGGFAAASAPAFTVPAGQRQLFLVDGGIAKIENLKRTLHQPRKNGAVIRGQGSGLTGSRRGTSHLLGPV